MLLALEQEVYRHRSMVADGIVPCVDRQRVILQSLEFLREIYGRKSRSTPSTQELMKRMRDEKARQFEKGVESDGNAKEER
jgi:hypothetical protein